MCDLRARLEQYFLHWKTRRVEEMAARWRGRRVSRQGSGGVKMPYFDILLVGGTPSYIHILKVWARRTSISWFPGSIFVFF